MTDRKDKGSPGAEEVLGSGRSQEAASPTDGDGVVAPLSVEAQTVALWLLLDDIDTASDMAKADDAAYRRFVESHQRKRFDIMSGEAFDRMSAYLSTTSEGRLSSISAREAQAEPERPEHNTSTVLPEADVGELVARIQKRVAEIEEHVGRYPSQRESTTWKHAEDLKSLLDLITRLVSDKARLEGELAEFQKLAGSADKLAWSMAERAERAEAERDEHLEWRKELAAQLLALKQRVAEVLEPISARCAEAVRPDDADSAGVTVRSEHLRRAAELHASLRSSEGQPTDEGRRASPENTLTQERK